METSGAPAIHILLNASSGLRQKDKAPDALRSVFAAAGRQCEIHAIKHGIDICGLVQTLVGAGARIIVAGGGDGTLNAVASVLAGTDVAMGVLAAGTLNHFARDLDIPFDLEDAARVILAGRTIQVDMGEVNGRRFLNNAIIGLYPFYRSRRERLERRGSTPLRAMLSAVYSVIRKNPALTVSYQVHGRVVTRRTPILMVANNFHQMEGYQLGTRPSLNSGQLWLYAMHRMSRFGLFGLTLRLMLGRFSKRRDFEVVGAREITVESRRKRIGVSLDGEVVRLKLPLCYRSLPGALKVIVPAAYQARS